jgi:membrane protease YdiL (CAAX protease family)
LEIPAQLILLLIPSIIYLTVKRRLGEKWEHILVDLGWTGSKNTYFLQSLGMASVIGALMLVILQMIPKSVLESPMVSTSFYAEWSPSLISFVYAWIREAFYITLGEEIFFRGLLGGWLERRIGFWVGNAVQAVVFLLPHLLLLMVSTSFWLVVVLQFLAGWVLGWIRSRSGSILPGWLAHSLMNAVGALASMW